MKTEILAGMSSVTWEQVKSEAEAKDMILSKESERIARFFFEMGHKYGQKAMLDIVGDMYTNDPDELVEVLEDQYL